MNHRQMYVDFLRHQSRLQAELGLSDDEQKILVYLAEAEQKDKKICQAQLIKQGGFGKAPKLMVLIKKLTQADLIRREVGDDLRAFDLRLTQNGIAYLESLDKLMTKVVVAGFANFNPNPKSGALDVCRLL